VILFVEVGIAPLFRIVLELLIADGKQFPIFLRCHGRIQIAAARNVSGKGKYIHPRRRDRINDAWYFHTIRFGYRGHDDAPYARSVETGNLL